MNCFEVFLVGFCNDLKCFEVFRCVFELFSGGVGGVFSYEYAVNCFEVFLVGFL